MKDILRNSISRRAVLAALGVVAASSYLASTGALFAQEKKRVALILVGSISDGGWDQLAYQGLMDLKEEGYDAVFVENVAQARIPSVARGYADDGYDLIIGHGFQFGSAFVEMAPDYPDQYFFATTFAPEDVNVPNLAFIDLGYKEAAYVAGAFAAMISESKKVGFVGGDDNPVQQLMNKAFIAGAERTVEGTQGMGIVTGDYHNAAKGKEAALTMIGNGADVIWHAAAVTGIGALQGAAGAGAKVIGCYSNQTELSPERMATSFVTNLRWMVRELGHKLVAGEFPGGSEWKPTVKESWVLEYGPLDNPERFNNQMVSAEVQAKFDQLFEDVGSGKIDLSEFK